MASPYTENPLNFSEITPFVKTAIEDIKTTFFTSARILFYDACSFQRHSNLRDKEQGILIKYYKDSNVAIFITRCILMELASNQHKLLPSYVDYIKHLNSRGVDVIIYDEEFTYDILSECFSTNEKINEYLVWAVRMVKSPINTIEETLARDEKLNGAVIKGKDIKSSGLYRRFFQCSKKKQGTSR